MDEKNIPDNFPELKLASNDHPVMEEIRKRWSIRSFSPKPVEPEKIASLFEAVRWAPSSMNDQPWRFIIATADQPEPHAKLASMLNPGNRVWAEKAPLLVMSLARNMLSIGHKNTHAWHDLGGAHMALSLQAIHLDLYLHQMAGFDTQKARDAYQIPEDLDPVIMLAIGYRKDPNELTEPFFTRELTPRTRHAISDFVFEGEWGKTWKY